MTVPLFHVENVSGARFPATNFSLDPGAVLLVEGVSGSGKSQLLRALADLEPHEGEIRLEGRRQRETSPADWRRQVMLVPAESAWWSDYVFEHFSQQPDEDWLQRLSLRPSLLDAPIERLSSGERQRLAILRALVLKPKVLLLDEPTANLDLQNTEAVAALVREYLQRHQAAAVWVTHDHAERERLGGQILKMEAVV